MKLYLLVELVLGEWHKTLLMISQHCFRQRFGAVRKQAITWANMDPDLCRQNAWMISNSSFLLTQYLESIYL